MGLTRGNGERSLGVESLALESTVSERGQITLPKQVRDMLNVNAQDKIGFYKTEEGVLIKNNSIKENNHFMNLLDLLTKETNVVVQGAVGVGKTSLLGNLLEKYFGSKKVLVLSGDSKYCSPFEHKIRDGETNFELYRYVPNINFNSEGQLRQFKEDLAQTEVLVIDYSDFPNAGVSMSDRENLMEKLLKDYKGLVLIETHKQLDNWFLLQNDTIQVEIIHKIRSLSDLDASVKVTAYEVADGDKYLGDFNIREVYKPY